MLVAAEADAEEDGRLEDKGEELIIVEDIVDGDEVTVEITTDEFE